MSARRLSAYTAGDWVCPGSMSEGSGGSAAGAASGTTPSRRKAAVNDAKVEAMAGSFRGEGTVPLCYPAGRRQASRHQVLTRAAPSKRAAPRGRRSLRYTPPTMKLALFVGLGVFCALYVAALVVA